MPFLVVTALAVIYPLNELEKAFKGGQSIELIHGSVRMDCQIAEAYDKWQLSPCLGVQSKAERWLMYKGLQILIIGHIY